MPQIRAQVMHELSMGDVEQRLDQWIESLESRYPTQVRNVRHEWKDEQLHFAFHAYGFEVSWIATVFARHVDLIGEIPIAARMFEDKMERTLVSRIEEALTPMPIAIRKAA